VLFRSVLPLYLCVCCLYICACAAFIFVRVLSLHLCVCCLYICACAAFIFVRVLPLYLCVCCLYICACAAFIFSLFFGIFYNYLHNLKINSEQLQICFVFNSRNSEKKWHYMLYINREIIVRLNTKINLHI
jgi:hypothetical protein